ncbi:MAG: tRNA (adenosine(37)-N6)-dimethylallyltransferase MiaA [Cyclobacteriaceae bacterium]|nr:tRNA (adenosine(37)-N6)-dimethylallyltransferase MiaA [Cyclobacteriaceae bacterium]
MHSKKLIVIIGPTAVGKTAVSIQLATYFKTEIISADSRQIYKELEIGTAKPSPEELAMVKHHFINTHSIEQDYDAGGYERDAISLLDKLFKKHDSLVLCGGSGLYVKAVLEGFDEMPEIPEGTRERIMEGYQKKGLEWLQEKVKEADPEYFELVDQKNPHRLMRALEIHIAGSKPLGELRNQKKVTRPFSVIKIGLELEREELYQRIDSRMDAMIAAGLFEEAEQLYPKRNLNALQTVGYREIFDFMDNQFDKEEAIRLLKRNSRRYAKRQLTWYKRDPEINWFRPERLDEIMRLIENG